MRRQYTAEQRERLVAELRTTGEKVPVSRSGWEFKRLTMKLSH